MKYSYDSNVSILNLRPIMQELYEGNLVAETAGRVDRPVAQ